MLEIGCDLTEIYRVKKSSDNRKVCGKSFSPAEQDIVTRGMQKFASYAARFAAKEALLKALGTGLRGGKLIDIEVYNDCMGKPSLRLSVILLLWLKNAVSKKYIFR